LHDLVLQVSNALGRQHCNTCGQKNKAFAVCTITQMMPSHFIVNEHTKIITCCVPKTREKEMDPWLRNLHKMLSHCTNDVNANKVEAN